jgi:hypothetical protein
MFTTALIRKQLSNNSSYMIKLMNIKYSDLHNNISIENL